MNEFYQNQLAQAAAHHQQQQQQQRRQHPGTPANMMMPPNLNTGGHGSQRSPTMQQPMMSNMSPDTPMMGVGDSLDEIISQNTATRRRRSVPHPYSPNQAPNDEGDRRMSMNLEFGSSNDHYRGFQFDSPLTTTAPPVSMADGLPAYGNMTNMTSPMNMHHHPGNFEFPSMSPDVMNNMMGFSNLSMGQMHSDPSAMGLYNNPNMSPQFGTTGMDTVSPDFAMDMTPENPLSVAAANASVLTDDGDDEMMVGNHHFGSNSSGTPQAAQGSGGAMAAYNMTPALPREVSNASSFNQSPVSPGLSTARGSVVPETPMPPQAESGSATPGNADVKSESKNIYSKSGFDLVRALYYIATRPNPEIQLGAVDLSCAFVVCDVTMNDCPIIYISDNFQNLTGYSRHDIMGQNCRFLQAPDGKVEAGTKREFVANDAVLNLKQKIQEGKEVQQSLINYRKGGKPFLNLLTMIPIPWDTKEIRYFIGFQIDLVECPDAIAGQELGKVAVNYKHSDIGQYIWNPPEGDRVEPDAGQTLSADDVSTLLQQLKPGGTNLGDWHKQSWDKMLLENADDVVHVLSLKGLFMYLSPSCKRVLEYDTKELIGNQLSSICHPSDIVPVTRELKDTAVGNHVNIVFRIRRKESGYTWFESHGSLFVEQGKGKKCIILVGRKRPVFALSRSNIETNGGIGDGELWSKLSTSGMYLFVSSNCRSLLDLQPNDLVGTSIQDQMRKETRPEFGRSIEKARKGKIVKCKHEVQNKRGQILQAQTILYPGDAVEGQKPTFLLAQTKLLKASSRALAPASASGKSAPSLISVGPPEDALQPSHGSLASPNRGRSASGSEQAMVSQPQGGGLVLGNQDAALASDDNIFDELKTTRCSSWQYELRQMEKVNRLLAEELGQLLSNKKKRKRRKGVGNVVRDCANCHTRNTPEWRRGPSGQRDLCNSCGLRYAKQTGRVSPRTSSRGGNGDSHSKKSGSPKQSSPLHHEIIKVADSSAGTRPQKAGAPDSSGNGSKTTRSPSSASAPNNSAANTNSGSGSSSAGGSATPMKIMMPPPSQPLLEGGSGVHGHSMSMPSIAEERD